MMRRYMNFKTARTKWLLLCRRHFQIHFHEWKSSYFYSNSQKFVHRGLNDYMASLVQATAWCRKGDKPLPEPLMTSLIQALFYNDGIWPYILFVEFVFSLATLPSCSLVRPSWLRWGAKQINWRWEPGICAHSSGLGHKIAGNSSA